MGKESQKRKLPEITQLLFLYQTAVLSVLEPCAVRYRSWPHGTGQVLCGQHKGLPVASGIVVRTAEPWPLVSPAMCTTWHLHSLGRRWQRMSATLSSWVPEQILRLHVSSSDDVVWAPVYQRLWILILTKWYLYYPKWKLYHVEPRTN